jgi:hypothetical protein
LGHLMRELNLPDAQDPTPTYNDNKGTIDWSSTGAITKRLRHINMKEVAIRDAIHNNDVKLAHIAGKRNPSDILTKEDRDQQHYMGLRDVLVPPLPDMGGVGIMAAYQEIAPSVGKPGDLAPGATPSDARSDAVAKVDIAHSPPNSHQIPKAPKIELTPNL